MTSDDGISRNGNPGEPGQGDAGERVVATEQAPVPGEAQAVPGPGERVAFCQDCGKPLTRETVRTVGTGVFCEPCLERRIGMPGPATAAGPGQARGGGWSAVPPVPGAGAAGNGGAAAPPPPGVRPLSDEPSPAVAALLGLIPGVGAMYNGQFAKGAAHLAIFAVLVSFSNNISGIFGLFVVGWVFYQSFEAYHTAKARRDGLPLPNPFGLNDIGERFNVGGLRTPAAPGAAGPAEAAAARAAGTWVPPVPGAPTGPEPGKAWAGSEAANSGWAGAAPSSAQATAASSAGTYGYRVTTPGPAQTPSRPSVAESWLGYVPPQNLWVPPAPGTPMQGTPGQESSWAGTPTGTPWQGASGPGNPPAGVGNPGTPPPYQYQQAFPGAGAMPVDPLTQSSGSRMPSAAIWLIGLGVVVLLFNIMPGWHLGASWVAAGLLAGIAAWLMGNRISAWGDGWHRERGQVPVGMWVHAARFPALLLTLAVLLALQAAHWLTVGQSWPLLLVVIGAMLLLERTLPVGSPFPAGTFETRQGPGWRAPANTSTPGVTPQDAAAGGAAEQRAGSNDPGNGGRGL